MCSLQAAGQRRFCHVRLPQTRCNPACDTAPVPEHVTSSHPLVEMGLLSVFPLTETDASGRLIPPVSDPSATSSRYWSDFPARSSPSSTDFTHSSGSCTPLLTLSLLPSTQCNYHTPCVFAAHRPSLEHGEQVRAGVEEGKTNEWERREQSAQESYGQACANYCMQVIKRH